MATHGDRTREFAVAPPPAHAGWIMALLLLVPLVVLAFAFARPGNGSGPPMLGLALALGAMGVAVAVSTVGLRRRKVTLADGQLTVVAGLFTHRVHAIGLDLDRARVLSLDEHPELRPFLKTGGMSLPGYHAGRFRLRGKFGKAFCLLTDRRRVLWLPYRDGKDQLLLSLERPQALLDALRAG
jgi:hypothetical protein